MSRDEGEAFEAASGERSGLGRICLECGCYEYFSGLSDLCCREQYGIECVFPESETGQHEEKDVSREVARQPNEFLMQPNELLMYAMQTFRVMQDERQVGRKRRRRLKLRLKKEMARLRNRKVWIGAA